MTASVTFGSRATGIEARTTVRSGLKRLTLSVFLLMAGDSAFAEKKYGPGVSDTESRLAKPHLTAGPLRHLARRRGRSSAISR
jgi:hypothetical protein